MTSIAGENATLHLRDLENNLKEGLHLQSNHKSLYMSQMDHFFKRKSIEKEAISIIHIKIVLP